MFRRFPRAAAILLILPGFAAANSGLIRVTNIRSWSHADSTRVILDTSGPFEFHSERAFNPDRLFFDVQKSRPLMGGRRFVTHQINDSLVRRVRIAETTPGTTRIVFDLTGPVTYKVMKLDTPDRMVIEVRAGRPEAPAALFMPTISRGLPFVYPPLLSSPRRTINLAGMPAAFDPAPRQMPFIPDWMWRVPTSRPAAVRTLAVASPSPRLIPPARPMSYDAMPRASENAARSLTRALGLKVNRIVIDAGHGGHDDGTIGPGGTLEKDVVLDVALRLAKLVQSRMSAEVVLTRSDDTFIPLQERTAIANDRKADLFLSIHANSSPAPAVAGTETFYLNLTNSPSALDVASRENAGADKSVGELRDLIQSITLNDKIAESETFAQTVETSLYGQAAKSNVAAKNRGVKRAPFVVLIGASMPSILAEIGFLTNARDEANLARPEYRQKVAEALYKGLSQYSQSLSHFDLAGSGASKTERPARAGLN
ncbi:MAG: N-acetylmuramoyl-L-alanine amidase [Terriglobia bacterium]